MACFLGSFYCQVRLIQKIERHTTCSRHISEALRIYALQRFEQQKKDALGQRIWMYTACIQVDVWIPAFKLRNLYTHTCTCIHPYCICTRPTDYSHPCANAPSAAAALSRMEWSSSWIPATRASACNRLCESWSIWDEATQIVTCLDPGTTNKIRSQHLGNLWYHELVLLVQKCLTH